MTHPNMKFISGYWPCEFVAKIDHLAEKENRNRSNMLFHLVARQLQTMSLMDEDEEKSINETVGKGATGTTLKRTNTNTSSTVVVTTTPAAKQECDSSGR